MQGSCVHHMSLPDAHATLHAAYLDIASSGHQKVGEQQRRRRSSVSESAVSANQKPLDSLTFFLYPFFLPLFFTVSWPRAYPGPGPTQGWGMLPAAIYKTRSVVRDLVQLQPSPRSTRVVDSQKRPAASSVGASSDKAAQTAKKPRGAASPDPHSANRKCERNTSD